MGKVIHRERCLRRMVAIEGVDLDTVEGGLQPVHSGALQQKFRKLFTSRQVVSEAFDRKIGGMCPTGSSEVVRAKRTRKTREKGPPSKERKGFTILYKVKVRRLPPSHSPLLTA